MKRFRLVHFVLLSLILGITLWHISCGYSIPIPVFFDLKVTTDRDTYAPGENVTANITFTNVYDKAYIVKPSPPTVLVEKLDTGLPVIPVVAIFPGIEEERLLQPGQSVNWSVSWDQRDQDGNQVSPGRYLFELEFKIVHNAIESQIEAPGSIIKIEATEG